MTYVSAIDDPGRFKSSKAVGAHFGLTPKKYQSGETDVTGRISKIGDGGGRTAFMRRGCVKTPNLVLSPGVRGDRDCEHGGGIRSPGARARQGRVKLRFCYEAGPCQSGAAASRGRADGGMGADAGHEAMRDLVRARLDAVHALRRARQLLSGSLLRQRCHYGRPAWTKLHRRWLAGLRFEQAAHHLVLEDYIQTVEAAEARRDRLTAQIAARLPEWSLAPVVAAL